MKMVHKDGGRKMLVNRILRNIDINPDPNDSNFHCCQRDYSSRDSFRTHIRRYHPNVQLQKINCGRMPTITSIMPEIDNGNINNTTCTICEKNYRTRKLCQRHIQTYHKKGGRGSVEKGGTTTQPDTNNVVPIWDPNHYCRSCKRAYSIKPNYQRHIKTFHSNVLQESKQLSTNSNSTHD